MTPTSESDGTYFSEVKKKHSKIKIESIKKVIKEKQKGRVSFILKKINKNMQKSSPICPNESPTTIQPSQNYELVKSPNILAGMMTEVLTEIPPYQPEYLPEVKGTVENSEPTIMLTQKNPLDLTKKNLGVQVVPDKDLSQDFSEREKQQQAKTRTSIKAVPFEQRNEVKVPTATTTLDISKDSTIDLTEENVGETNGENIVPIMKGRTARTKSPVHVSKWLQFLPNQQRPTYSKKPPNVTTSTTTSKQKSKSLKDSIIKLYRDQATTSISNSIQKPSTTSFPKKTKLIQKLNSPSIRSQSNKPFRNAENIITRDANLTRVSPRKAQSEHFGNISPDFLLDEVFESDMNDGGSLLTPSLKEGFREVFGTDKLKDVFGGDEVVYGLKENHVVGDEVVYCLKENHVRCLARALKIEHGILNQTIENILSNDNCGLFQDDNMQSDYSVVECSQSPPQQIFPSQRSQTN